MLLLLGSIAVAGGEVGDALPLFPVGDSMLDALLGVPACMAFLKRSTDDSTNLLPRLSVAEGVGETASSSSSSVSDFPLVAAYAAAESDACLSKFFGLRTLPPESIRFI